MASDKQIEANRLNAQKSTGPRSPEGKDRSRFNSLQSGIDAESLVLPGEDPAAAETLRAEYYELYQPETAAERDTLDGIVHSVCLLRRFRRLEPQLTRHELDSIENLDPVSPLGHVFSHAALKFVYLQSRINSAERAFHRGLDRLDRLQSQRPPAEAPPEPAPQPQPAQPQPAQPQPPETTPPTPELASFPEISFNPDKDPVPPHHPTDPKQCPFCSKLNRISPFCHYLRQRHGAPLPGHPTHLVDCPDCRTLGYISPTCRYTLQEPPL